MNKPSRMFPFLAGLLLGILAAVYLPGQVRPHLPEWVTGKDVVVKGTVAAKQKKEGALLVSVNTAEGALLATFTRNVDEVGLLIDEKDEIEFTLPKYAPFITDPKIVRITKDGQGVPASAPTSTPAAPSADRSLKDVKPQPQAGRTGKSTAARK